MTETLPKVELHCHLEGTLTPQMASDLARRNGLELSPDLLSPSGGYAWTDFKSFLRSYDLASRNITTSKDYEDVTYAYLSACARERAIYVEVFASPDHARAAGLSYVGMLEGTCKAIDRAQKDHKIIGRIITTCVRHLGPRSALRVAELARDEPHPYVVGFGMGGDETLFEMEDFAPAYKIAADAGLGCTVHAGEARGAESVRSALDVLPVTRIGHGVRSAEDSEVMARLVRRDITLEVCLKSNIALSIFPTYADHTLRRLLDAGCRVTLNSDDPPFFASSIGAEYALAQEHFALDDQALLRVTGDAIDAAFVDDQTKEALRARLQGS